MMLELHEKKTSSCGREADVHRNETERQSVATGKSYPARMGVVYRRIVVCGVV